MRSRRQVAPAEEAAASEDGRDGVPSVPPSAPPLGSTRLPSTEAAQPPSNPLPDEFRQVLQDLYAEASRSGVQRHSIEHMQPFHAQLLT